MKGSIQKLIGKRGYRFTKVDPLDDRELYHKLYPKSSIEKRRFYNINGGGHGNFGNSFTHPFWTNVDLLKSGPQGENYNPDRDIAHDLLDLKPLPIESNSAELFYSQYCIEHITDEAAIQLFKEAHRTLKKGGIFKIVCPNNILDYIAYLKQDYSYFSWIEKFSKPGAYQGMHFKHPLNQASLEQVFIVHFASNASTIHVDGIENPISDTEVKSILQELSFEKAMTYFTNKCSVEKQRKYRRDHISWWSPQKLNHYLKEAGFSMVNTLSQGQSAAQVMRNNQYFDRHWPFVALYVEAHKF